MKRLLSIILLLSVVGGTSLVYPVSALADATLVISPGTISVQTGASTTVTISVNTTTPVNSVDFKVTFPPALLAATSVDTNGTVFPVTLFQPQVDASAGTVHFVQTSVSPYSGNGGKIGSITFQAKTAGSGSIGISDAKVIASDGKGTNVYSGANGATITAGSATPAPTAAADRPAPTQAPVATTAAPQIRSSTNPDQNAWYKSRSVIVEWGGGGSGYNFAFDQTASTQLPAQSVTTTARAATTLSTDGVWYAHVRTLGSNGWSTTSSYKLQVDATAPASFTPTFDPPGEITSLPKVLFEDTDAASGVDHFEVQVDSGDWVTATSPYKVPSVAAGTHLVAVKAIDKAGNSTIGQASFSLKAVGAPVVTSPSNNQLVMLGQTIQIAGRAAPHVAVDLFINDKKIETVVADAAGTFQSKDSLLLFAGAYKILATAVNSDGVSSSPSAAVNLTVDARAIKIFGAIWPGWVVLITILSVIFLLLILGFWLSLRVWLLGRLWVKRVKILRGLLHNDLGVLEDTVAANIDQTIGATNPDQAKTVKQELAFEVAKFEEQMEEATDQLVAPTPLLPDMPILHGRERFGAGAKTNNQPNEKTDSPTADQTNQKAAAPAIPAVSPELEQVASMEKIEPIDSEEQVVSSAAPAFPEPAENK